LPKRQHRQLQGHGASPSFFNATSGHFGHYPAEMPTLNWIGKEAVVNHHHHVPFHLLKDVPDLSTGDPGTGKPLTKLKCHESVDHRRRIRRLEAATCDFKFGSI
jgi:hypothetical protein